MYIYVKSKNIQQHLLQMIICVLIRNPNQEAHNILNPNCGRQTPRIQKNPHLDKMSIKVSSTFYSNKKKK